MKGLAGIPPTLSFSAKRPVGLALLTLSQRERATAPQGVGEDYWVFKNAYD